MAKQIHDLSLFDLLPDSIAGIQEVKDTAQAIDPEFLSVSQSIREALILSRIDELPEPVLDLLAWQYHVDNYEPLSLPIEQKRAQVKDAIKIHRRKGTPWALKQELKNIGFPVEIDEDTGQPYIFDVRVLLNGQADTTAVYNAAVKAAKRAKNVRSKIGTIGMETQGTVTLHAAAAGVYGISVTVYPWTEREGGGDVTLHAAASVTRLSVSVTVGPKPGAAVPILT